MAAPDVTLFDPADASVGVPVGDTIMVYFDTGIDLESAKKSVVLYGADFDTTSGPDIAMWVDEDSGNNPFFSGHRASKARWMQTMNLCMQT